MIAMLPPSRLACANGAFDTAFIRGDNHQVVGIETEFQEMTIQSTVAA